MSINHIRLYDLFRRELHLPDDKAADAVYAIQEVADSSFTARKDVLATKENIYSLELATKESINSLKADMNSFKLETKESINSLKEDMNSFKLETKEDISLLRSEISSFKAEFNEKLKSVVLKTDLQDTKDKLYRAIYLSGIVQFIALAGVLVAILKWLK